MTRSKRSKTVVWYVFVLIVLLGTVALFAAARIPVPQNAYAGPGRYEIQCIASNKFLTASTQEGNYVRQWGAANTTNQWWDIDDAGHGYVYIKSAENGMALDIEGGIARDEAKLILTPLSNTESQMWRLEDQGGGIVRVISRAGKAIDLPGDDHDNGVRFILWKPIDKDVERFRLRLIAAAPRRDGDRDRDRDRGESNWAGEKSTYDLGYSLGVQDARAQLRRTFARHRGEYDRQWEDSFIEGYYDGYDNGRTDTSLMRDEEKESYNAGFRRGRQDYEQGKKPNFMRYADQFDQRSEPFFRRGYEDGYYKAR